MDCNYTKSFKIELKFYNLNGKCCFSQAQREKNLYACPKCKTANCVNFGIIVNNFNYLKKHSGI